MSANIQLPQRYSPDLRLLGSGGFGAVYRTTDSVLGQQVAVKVPFQRGSGPGAREVLVELRAAASLRHPSFVQVLDAGLDPAGTPYLVMDYANLGSLSRPLERGGLTWEQVAPWLEDLVDGLAYAHARGLVHRDVKPENILFKSDEAGRVRALLADFGLAKVLQGRRDYRSTRLMAGTLLYMPPESFEDDPTLIHPGVDLYALGVILHQLVSGRSPWAVGGAALLLAKAEGRHRRLELPEEGAWPASLPDVVARLIAPDRADRFELASDLRVALFGEPELPPLPLPTAGHDTLDSSRALAPATRLPRSPPAARHPRPFPPTAALAVVREPLLVGREAERARLWTAAQRACLEPQALVLTGEAGQGRSRLTAWLCGLLHQHGAARTLRVRPDRTTSPTEAVAAALRTFLVLGRTSGAELNERLGRWLASRGHPDPAARDALAGWLDPDAQEDRPAADAREALAQRVAWTELVLRLEARRGLVCCSWEERPRGKAGAAFVALLALSARARPYPLLLLYEPQEGPLEALPEEHWPRLHVGPLTAAHLGEILADLAVVTPRIPAVALRARGNAARAVEAARLLCSGDFPMGGLAPDDTEELDLADLSALADETLGTVQLDAPQVGLIRLEGFCRGSGTVDGAEETRREVVLAALALLPRPCPPSRLLASWKGLDRWSEDELDAVVQALLLAGLVTRDGQGGLDFAGGELAHAADALLAGLPGLPTLRRACAAALVAEEHHGPGRLRAAAALLLDAGDAAEALELLESAATSLARVDSDAAQQAWDEALAAADAAGVGEADPSRVRVVVGAARSARESGDIDRAEAGLATLDPALLRAEDAAAWREAQAAVLLLRLSLVEARAAAQRSVEGFAAVGDAVGVARARLLAADALTRQGLREQALPELERALREAEAAGAQRETMWARWLLARCLRASGLRDRAAQELEATLALARELGVAAVEGAALRELGNVALLRGEQEEAAGWLRQSATRLEEVGLRGEAAVTRISLGELARARGDLRQARREYSTAFAVTHAYGLTSETLVTLVNLALTELALERTKGARRRLTELDRLLPPGTAHGLRLYIEALRLVFQAQDEAWEAAEDTLETLAAHPALPPDPDLLWLLERAATTARDAGESPLAVDVGHLALGLAERLGDAEAQDRLRRAMGGG